MYVAGTAETFDRIRRAHRPDKAANSRRRDAVSAADELSIRLGTVVVPLDGSDFAEHALPLAIAIARRSGAVLRLVHAYTPFESLFVRPGVGYLRTLERHFRQEALTYLSGVERRLTELAADVTVITQFIETKDVAGSLRGIAEGADLVVMATRGRGWLGRLWRGSVAHDTVARLSRPVVLVRGSDTPVDLTGDPLPRHLIIPLDGEKGSEKILESAGVLSRICRAKSTLLHIDEPDKLDSRFPHGNAADYLGHTRRKLSDILPGAETRVLKDRANIARGVLDFAGDVDGALIAVTIRRREGLTFPRIAETLIRTSPVPVLVIRE